jgi:hypothetical protein
MFKFLRIFLVLSIAMISMLIAATPTLYVCGVEDLARRTRHDTLNVETAAGSLSAYTAPSASINSLIIQFVGNAGVASSVLTTTTIPATVKDVWLIGSALGYDTVTNGGFATLPLPVLGGATTIHFALTTAPATAARWFTSLPSDCKILVEPGVDPLLENILGFSSARITLKRSIDSGTAATITPRVIKDSSIPSVLAASNARITMGANTTFSGGLTGVSLSGAYVATINGSSEVIDPTGITGCTLATGIDLTVIATASGTSPLNLGITTLGTGASITQTQH